MMISWMQRKLREMSKCETELKLMPGIGITPRRQFVAPCDIVLGAAQARQFVGTVRRVAMAPFGHVNRRLLGSYSGRS
jgi:hypothetical protein